jgi:hypothetical protein
MTPRELFAGTIPGPCWVHGSDLGVDEDGGLWVRATAHLKEGLASRVHPLGERITMKDFREYSILTPEGQTILDPRHRTEPLWRRVQELSAESIGSDWIAVH